MLTSARLHRVILAGLLALALIAPAALVARAADIPGIGAPVTDDTGLLDGDEAEIEKAITALLETANVQLWVVFVPTTGGRPATDYATDTANANSLGANDALLLVAIEDRTDAIWVADGLDEITDQEIDEIIGTELEPRLADGDFVGAVVATAEALGQAATNEGATEPPATPPPAGGFEGPGGETDDGIGWLVPLVLILVGGGLVGSWFVSRRSQRREAEERDRRTGRLAREANALLIATDDRVRDANQEIGFVEAEYGEPEVGPLRAAVDAAREELKGAFAVRQRLDDGEPETPEQREAMLNEVVERSKKAQAALDAEAARIQALRDLERDAPTILERLPERIAAVEARLPASRAAFDALAAYAPSTRAPIAGHLEEARKGLDGARTATDRGQAAITAGNRRGAAHEARTAEVGLTGATALLDAVDKLAAAAREAQARLAAELDDAETDLAAARAAARDAGPGLHDGRLNSASTALRQAQGAALAVPTDPIAALRAAAESRRVAGEALAAIRQDAEQRARFLAAVENSVVTAQADLDRAADFIATRRGTVGRQARTRLAEADRLLGQAVALRDRDPQQALEAARRAERLAEEAYDLADDDFDQFGGMGGSGRGGQGGQGADLAGAILGGIIGGILSGGGRGGGGWGGSPWGSSGPSGGGGGWGGPFGGGGGGGWGGGGFGGGGGGGGRSRGGRW